MGHRIVTSVAEALEEDINKLMILLARAALGESG
jgi:hypothetical protein